MGDLLRQGSQWLEQMRTTHCSSPVTYRRGETEAVVNATYGRTEYEVEDADGMVFEVMSLGGQGHWRWSDPHRQTLRIHTKETGAQ